MSSFSGCGWIQEVREGNVEKQEKKNKMSNPILFMLNLALTSPAVGTVAVRATFYRNTLSLKDFDDFPAGAQNVWQR